MSCQQNRAAASLPIRERLYLDDYWRVAHGWSSLPGWLVVVSRRHLSSLAEADAAETAALGPLLHAASAALHDVTGCSKTYIVLFAELDGHQHVHFHVVPRMQWFGPDERGTAVFRFLNLPEAEQVPISERQRLSVLIGDEMRTRLAAQ